MGLYKQVLNKRTGQFNLVPSGVLITFKPGVANAAALPSTGNTENDARITNDNGHLYIWSGTAWVDQGDVIDFPTPITYSTEDVTYSIDGVSGDDDNDGINAPFKTITKAISVIPSIVNHVLKFNITSNAIFDEQIVLANKSGSGFIWFFGHWGNAQDIVLQNTATPTYQELGYYTSNGGKNTIEIHNCSCKIDFQCVTILTETDSGSAGVFINGCPQVSFGADIFGCREAYSPGTYGVISDTSIVKIQTPIDYVNKVDIGIKGQWHSIDSVESFFGTSEFVVENNSVILIGDKVLRLDNISEKLIAINTPSFSTGVDNYNLVLEDSGKLIDVDSTEIVYAVVPRNSDVAFPIGTTIAIRQKGVGQVAIISPASVSGEDDVVIQYAVGPLTTGQYAVASLLKIDTDTWSLCGSLETLGA